eukprot:6175153-Pleurochrysis_carterae.AAC.1
MGEAYEIGGHIPAEAPLCSLMTAQEKVPHKCGYIKVVLSNLPACFARPRASSQPYERAVPASRCSARLLRKRERAGRHAREGHNRVKAWRVGRLGERSEG